MSELKATRSDTRRELISRARIAGSTAELWRLEQSADRLYAAGLLSVADFRRVDNAVMSRYVDLEESA